MSDYQKRVNELDEIHKVTIYRAYLDAFSVVRSGGQLASAPGLGEEADTYQLTARAIGAETGADHTDMVSPRWLLLENVGYLLYAVDREAPPCKVVPLGGETAET